MLRTRCPLLYYLCSVTSVTADCCKVVWSQGSWQIPLHMVGPSREDPTFHGNSLKDNPRVTCSSLLIRILSMSTAKAAIRRKSPSYADR